MSDELSATIWDVGSLCVTASVTSVGDVLIAGQDLKPGFCDEYEYWISVKKVDVARLARALGGPDGAHPVGLLREHAQELIAKGEKTWLEEAGIVPEFFSRVG